MQCGEWHLIGATLVALALTTPRWASAQNCPHCVGETVVGDSGIIHDSGVIHEAGVAGHGLPGGCGACARKASYWYLPYTERSQADVFYNFYVPNTAGMPAGAYPAPLPTPPRVGHVYYTYQPLMPHEFLYKHHRSYHQFYNNGMGLNRTSVKWQVPPMRTAAHSVRKFFKLPR